MKVCVLKRMCRALFLFMHSVPADSAFILFGNAGQASFHRTSYNSQPFLLKEAFYTSLAQQKQPRTLHHTALSSRLNSVCRTHKSTAKDSCCRLDEYCLLKYGYQNKYFCYCRMGIKSFKQKSNFFSATTFQKPQFLSSQFVKNITKETPNDEVKFGLVGTIDSFWYGFVLLGA